MPELPVVVVWGLKATLLFLGGLVATSLLRRASAATRHFVWVLATGAALALPVVTFVAPRLEVALPTPFAAASHGGALPSAAQAAVPAATPGTTAPAVSTASAASASTPSFPSGPSLADLWAVGAVLVLAMLAVSLWRTAGLARRARPLAHVGVIEQVRELGERLGVRRPVRMLHAGDAAMPMTWGVLRPTVLLPAGFIAWPASRRRAVLLHELAHVRRWDCATQLAARLACALYWWNPLVWIAARRLRDERELACDDLVLMHGAVPAVYAGDLLEIARAFRASPATALAGVAMARRAELAGRLLAVLDAARSRRPVAPGHAWSAAAAAAVLLLPVAGLAAGVGPGPAGASLPDAIDPSAPAVRVVVDPAPGAGAARARPAQTRSAMLCDWRARGASGSSSTSINDDRMMIQIGRDGCTITVRTEGELSFSDDDRDLTNITDGGYVEIEERSGRSRRRVEITDDRGGMERRWFVDGREQPYGDDARAWLGDALLVLVRRAGINAEARAIRILTTQGEDALIAEIAELYSDHVAGRYYRVLFERGKLTSSQVSRLLGDAAERIESDHELGRVLETVAARGTMDAEVQRAFVRATGALDSDHEHSQALQALVAAGSMDVAALDAILASAGRIDSDFNRARVLLLVGERYPAGRPLPASYLDAVGSMGSDHERGRVLTQILERDRLSPADRGRVLGVVSRIASDHTRGQILMAVAAQGPIDAVTRDAYFAAVRGIDSDHTRQQVLVAVLAQPADDATALAVLDAARGIDSDHSKAGVLTALAGKGTMSPEVRAAYVAVAQTVESRTERERVMRAGGLQGT